MLQRIPIRTRLTSRDPRPRVVRARPRHKLLYKLMLLASEPVELHARTRRSPEAPRALCTEHMDHTRAERSCAAVGQRDGDDHPAEQLERFVGREKQPTDTHVAGLTAHGR